MIIGFGNKARQGKDLVAAYYKEILEAQGKEAYIIYWADELKRELANAERNLPLIKQVPINQTKEVMYDIFDNCYSSYTVEEVPYLHEIFTKRGITEYWGMDEKDSPMLQFWGTDFRRAQNKNYWVNKTSNRIKEIQSNNPEAIILIPDTRFRNEYEKLKDFGGIFIKVYRMIDTDTGHYIQYLDPERDPQHQSEIELDPVLSDHVITSPDGNIPELYRRAKLTFDIINFK